MPSPCKQPVDAYKHDGFYLRIAGGAEYVAFTGEGPFGDASVSGLGGGALIALGGNVSEGFVLAGAFRTANARNEFHGSPEEGDGDANVSAVQLGLLVDYFPDAREGWHLGGMAGIGFLGIESPLVDAVGEVFGGAILGGYDWWIGPEWSLGLMTVASATTSASLSDLGEDTGYSFNAFSVGLQYAISHH